MFEKVSKFLVEFQEGIKKVWEVLPKEVKVGLYLFASRLIEEIGIQINLIETNNWLLVAVINVVLVFLAEFPSRLVEVKKQLAK
jgi:hypothetical protein